MDVLGNFIVWFVLNQMHQSWYISFLHMIGAL